MPFCIKCNDGKTPIWLAERPGRPGYLLSSRSDIVRGINDLTTFDSLADLQQFVSDDSRLEDRVLPDKLTVHSVVVDKKTRRFTTRQMSTVG